ncbi:MAG: glycoside hydrolase family 3 C-terminal domain-containing protein [Ruminococcus flavefaciens]|nr:glycoside hydrolase family 3 C-terminal domain-containing protein [Ruminococcus flavefaciens]
MLAISMDDIIGVLETCKSYLIALGVILALGIIAIIACMKLKRSQKFLIRGTAGMAMVLAVVLIANLICLGPMSNLISLTQGAGQVTEETSQEARELVEEIAAEGFVLLQNEGNTLPLTGVTNVNLFGWASTSPAYGGTGSGGINDLFEVISLRDGLEHAGYQINDELFSFYQGYTSERETMTIDKQSWTLPEPPVSLYTDELVSSAKSFSDVALVVLSRAAGEGHNDLPVDVSAAAFDGNSSDYLDFQPGEHYLQLSKTERDMMDLVCDNFDTVIVLYNGANPLELGFVEEYDQIKATLWCAGPGNTGFESLGKILNGTVNPSGRTTDTFVYDMTQTPWWNNSGKISYTNMEHLAQDGMNAGRPTTYYPSFLNYAEGIYVGYKFYETAAAEGLIDYDKVVQFPFGHGLSYTSFTQTMSDLTASNGEISFEVTVTNTGSAAGKDVVEVFYNPPYTNGGIEKSTANLIDYNKTELLEPGQSQTLKFTIQAEDMASFDDQDKGCYVLEQGDYIISVNANSHEILDSKTYHQDSTVVYGEDNPRASDNTAAVARFDDIRGDVTYLSRADGFANYDQATAAPANLEMSAADMAKYHLNENFDFTTYLNANDTMPTTGKKGSMTLAEFRDADYDDPKWEDLLDQLTVSEMVNMISLAGYQTPAAQSVGKVGTYDFDGPAAINNNFTGAGSIGMPIATVIACTWSPELATRYGEIMGKTSVEMNAAGWYAPGVNLHRTPFGGRNYEYYSEDGVLSGLTASYAIQGAAEYGVYAYIKHFALYDFNGKMVCVWTGEQAMRENYLKPFEIGVKFGNVEAVMVSWSFLGTSWAGEDSRLMNEVLRDEWGFRGMALTDFFRNNGHGFMNADAALANGVDAMLATYGEGPNRPADYANPSASTVTYMRNACKNIMYTVVHSWMYDGQTQTDSADGWKTMVYVLDVVAVAVLAAVEVLVIRKSRKIEDK